MTTESGQLEIHVLGAGKGESIVIRCPDGKWGVVDCYSPSLRDRTQNPTLRFLQERGVSELEFLCLTHPHDDHYLGMSQLLDSFPVRLFWRFAGLAGRDVRRLAKYFKSEAAAAGDKDLLDDADEFVRTLALVKRKWKCGDLRVKHVGGGQQLYPVPLDTSANFQIWSFAPSGDQVEKYEQALLGCFSAEDRFLSTLPKTHHNVVSVGLLIEFGSTRVILGSDVEASSWNNVLRDFGPERMSADAVKVSHHGSENGYTENLWEHFSSKKKPIAIIVPYRRFGLPKEHVIEHIRTHSEKVLLTCPTTADSEPRSVAGDEKKLESRLVLSSRFGTRRVSSENRCGRCSLTFDDAGNCISSLTPPALQVAEG